jgi:Zn-dependent peptidase ImmA (M78 family)/transcriptional regulator with XRE-family HTH domain
MGVIPVKGDLLQWAREFRGLTERQGAELLGISLSELRSYENDKIKPTLGMFERFASRYKVPQSTLFREGRPSTLPEPKDFRTLAGEKPKQSFDFRLALSNIRALIFHIDRIALEDDEFVPPTIPRVRMSEDPFSAGERERKNSGVSIDEQLDWAGRDAFRKWRAAIEGIGIFVFQQKFPLQDCRGFTLFDSANAPVIVINKEEAFDVAKVFTLIHEMCHLFLREPGIPSYSERDPVEVFCNKFTAAFLMPLDALRAVLPSWPNQPENWERNDVAEWARQLKVSQMALALRLEQLGLAPSGFHRKFIYKGKATPPRGRPRHVAIRLSEIGACYPRVIIDALNRRAIDEVEAVEALGLGPDHLNAVKASLIRGRRQAVIG